MILPPGADWDFMDEFKLTVVHVALCALYFSGMGADLAFWVMRGRLGATHPWADISGEFCLVTDIISSSAQGLAIGLGILLLRPPLGLTCVLGASCLMECWKVTSRMRRLKAATRIYSP